MIKDTGERLLPRGNTQTLTYGEHLSRYLAAVKLVAGKSVLDVASGAGYGSQMLARQARTVEGLDYSKDAVEYAQKNFPAKNLRYNIGNAQDMPFKDNEFDVVVSLETIEHLPDPGKFVQEVKRVLKPEGLFIVSTPNDDEFMDGNEFHVHEFQFKELDRLIKSNFSQFSYYFQGTYFAAGLMKKNEFAKGFSEQSMLTSATFGQDTSKAIYFLALASNSKNPVPELESNLIVADRWSTKEDLERNQHRIDHIADLEKNFSKTIQQKDAEIAARDDELNEIKNSKAWKMITNVRKQKTKILNKKQ